MQQRLDLLTEIRLLLQFLGPKRRRLGSDLTLAVRRNPRASLIAAAAAGFLLGAILRRSD